MTTVEQISGTFVLIAEASAREHGTPFPKGLLEIGNRDNGWGVRLNTTSETIDDIEPYYAHVSWNGFPAGIICAFGGVIAAGELANESAFCEWLEAHGEA